MMHFRALYNPATAEAIAAMHLRHAGAALTRMLAVIVMAVSPSVASAHAVVLSAIPAINSSVPAGAIDVVLTFNSRIDNARSRLWLRGPDGAEHAVPLDAQPGPGRLAGHATVIAPGAWTLRWQVLSVDGHITRGDIPFVVQAGAVAR
ncbi:MAG TPA: copper resistance CopC family protein [Casimicrobiaceae bacterium]|nr:copper resistance CopC family protein [Casimicrobiaceae bacterium]